MADICELGRLRSLDRAYLISFAWAGSPLTGCSPPSSGWAAQLAGGVKVQPDSLTVTTRSPSAPWALGA